MRHLLSNAANPQLLLSVCLKRWSIISAELRESHRLRTLQMVSLSPILS